MKKNRIEEIIWLFFVAFTAVVLLTTKTNPPKTPSPTNTKEALSISLALDGEFFISTKLQTSPLIIYKKNEEGLYASIEIEASNTFNPETYPKSKESKGDWNRITLPTWEPEASLQKISNEKYTYYKKVGESYITITELDYTGGAYDETLESIIQSIKIY